MSQRSIKYVNGQIFTGEQWMSQALITTNNGRIVSVTHNGPADEVADLKGGKLVPAFIDLQLYGGNGLFFGEHPTVEALDATVAYSRAGGAYLILPTVATNSNEVAFAAIDAVREYWAAGRKGIAGLHLEGPFLNVKKRGAHAADKIQEPTVTNIRKLVEYGKGIVKMMTIAPELFTDEGIKILQDAGIIISAGHSDATYEQATAAFGKGIQLCTHLYNAMSPLQHRAPGLVGAIFDHPTVMSSIVTDGYHVDAAAIRIAKKLMGQRLFIITDAVTANPDGHYQHRLEGNRYVMPDGTLSGSALTMVKAVKYCTEQAGIDEGEALRMASLYPARVLGLDKEWGKIAPGYIESLFIIDQ
ncbi:N-acetylglucosamine-6-phosphate deacetylase [Flavihumibacter fluvii]|uniref:N-acetylglucosamine-6-phosphate deacetylase n=1 Tax=Flavihumibacter fluvii TaxID=2838157 RepID=UPI001BDEEFAA|nr:N-acetylglucosamine-6-phosphate deacetylase [Flavihumibacter fluvii]ULQ51671.1 N-acetylglucosamine-6-phosphate deacetylase [Flavihumibacter fluvii]